MKSLKSWLPRLIVSAVLVLTALFIRRYLVEIGFSWTKDLVITGIMFVVLVVGWTFFANINRELEKYFPFNKNTSLRIFIQILLGAGFILIIRLGGLYFAKDELPFDPQPIVIATMVGLDIFLALTINLAVISHYIIKRWKESLVKTEKLEQERIQMQYQTLRNQVNPHFLFNTFASLQAMINDNPKAASKYVGHLSKVYRYAIGNEEQVLVPLEKELEILELYSEVLKMRYDERIIFRINIDESFLEKKIVHMTLQNLVDNAIKHNEIHSEHPLIIDIKIENDKIIISNNIKLREQHSLSTKQGLIQLKRLYAYYSEEPVVYSSENEVFKVEIPLI
jgi:two-component system, LytTR family, sensor kinase